MRLVCLNTWGGKESEALESFLKGIAPTADFFCFQEVVDLSSIKKTDKTGPDVYARLRETLPDFESSFALMFSTKTSRHATDVPVGNAIFWKKSFARKSGGSIFPYGTLREKPPRVPDDSGLLQYETFQLPQGDFTVANFHGIATWPKTDTPNRLEQSRNLVEFLSLIPGPKVLCGDFNLSPGTESIAVLSRNFENLIERFGIAKTRSRLLYEKTPDATDKISDYAFSSPDISVAALNLPEAEVSDHLPLVLDFSLR